MGHEPIVIGYEAPEATVDFDLRTVRAPRPTPMRRFTTVARQLPAHLGLFSERLGYFAARPGFWMEPRRRWALQTLIGVAPRLVIANDWPALVVAAACKARTGVPVHYDSHEFAAAEFEDSLWWRIVHKPSARHLERFAIMRADSVSTVGPRLAEALQAYHGLAARPAVVRNTPDRVPLSRSDADQWPLRILYHGHLLPHRGLEALIASSAHWREPHRLILRGDGPASYVAVLRSLAAASPGSGRIRFEAAVPPGEVVIAAARSADLGVFFPPLDSRQLRYSLPNKLFEYIAAGLAVAVSPGDDLRSIVNRHAVGLVSDGSAPDAIARCINTFSPESVARCRLASLTAAEELCWENEREVLRRILSPYLTGR
jgi:glycosyltransferase involved in cell wall biosynthesis